MESCHGMCMTVVVRRHAIADIIDQAAMVVEWEDTGGLCSGET